MRARWAAVLTVLALAVVGSASAGPPAGRYLLPTRALWVDFEKPGSPRGYYTGELLELLGPVGVSNEVSRQLDHMRTLGVNEVELEMR